MNAFLISPLLSVVEPMHHNTATAARQLAAIVDSAEEAIVGEDLQGRIVAFNKAAERLLGYTAADAFHRPRATLIVDAPDHALSDIVDKIRAGQRGTIVEAIGLRKDGQRVAVSLSLSAIRHEAGELTGVSMIAADVSMHKQIEARLRLHEQALDAVCEGIIFTAPWRTDNPIIYVNPAFERITGYQRRDVIGKNSRFLQGPGTDPESVAALRRAVARHETCSVELLNYRADGTAFWNAISIAPLRDAQGRLTHFVGILSDVTRRQQLEEQVRQSQKMEAIGHLAGGIAHDFNNVLTIILGSAEFARDYASADGGELQTLLNEITEAGNRAATLTAQLLAFSRKQVLEPRVLDINVILTDLDKLLRRLIGEDIALEIRLDGELGHVKADPGQFEQIVMNLAVNARDAMPMGGSLVVETRNVEFDAGYLACHPEAPAGPCVQLVIRDTGCGMESAVLARAFEPFFTTKSVGEGTGMGLATVFGIVRQSEGHITVESQPGLGTTFCIYLPRVDLPVSPWEHAPAHTACPGGNETILLVEDEESVLWLARRILKYAGYTVLEAHDGEIARQVAADHDGPIHLLVTDLIMPVMSGLQVASLLSTMRPELRVLYVSGYTNDSAMRRATLEASEAFLQKPYTRDSLLRKVRHLLDCLVPA